MVTRISIIIIAMTCAASAIQTPRVVTNNYNDLNPERDAISMPTGSLRLTAYITDGAAPLDITGLTSANLDVFDLADNFHVARIIPTDISTNYIRWITFDLDLDPGTYHLTSTANYTGGGSMPIFSAYLTVTSPPTASSGCDVSVTVTNISEGGSTSTLDATNTPTAAGQMLFASGTNPAALYFDAAPIPGTNWTELPTVASGAGLYALTRTITASTTSDQWQIISGQLSTILNASYVADTNWTTVKFYANSTNEQTYTIPAGVTQCVIKCFGAGGGGGYAGTCGTTIQPISVIPGEVLTLRVGTRGLLATSSAGGVGGWPGGGNGYGQYGTTGTGGGGGFSAALRETNLLCIAGGGGGAGGGNVSGHHGGAAGGGITGANVPSGSTGGTQSSGGNAGGAFLQGGAGGAAAITGGGGGGYYGGGGGIDGYCGGAGGSGYVCDQYGYTYQGLLTGDADYEAGIGVANGDGMIVIKHPTP